MAEGEFDRILPSTDEKLPGWRLRVSAEDGGEIEIAEEVVHPEQVNNPIARHARRRAKMILDRREAAWLRDRLVEWLEATFD